MNDASLNERHCLKHDHKYRTISTTNTVFGTDKHNQFIPGS
jgi:hypothetical protein